MKVLAENLTIKTKYAGLLKEVGEPVAYRYKDHNGHWCFMVKPYGNNEPLFTSDQLVAAILKATKPLEEEVERLKTVPMKYRRMAFNAQLQDENKELRAQLTAAQEENGRLRIALDCTKTDLVRMRCPDFFEGVKDGYETLFDGHLVNMIGLINDYAKQK